MSTMTDMEYEFLTGRWSGPAGAAYNQVFEFCRSFGWCAGFDGGGRPVMTDRGIRAMKAFQAEQSRRSSEAH